MKRKFPITRLTLAFFVVSLFGLAGLGYDAYRTNLRSLDRLNQERLSWSSAQLQVEYLRFINALNSLQSGNGTTTAQNVQNRFDILWSRLALTQRGSVGARMREYDQHDGAIGQLFDLLKAEEEKVVNLDPDDRATLAYLVETFSEQASNMRDFNRIVFNSEERALAQIRSDLGQSSFFTAIAIMAAFLIGGLLVILVSNENIRSRRIAARNLALAREADKANQAKSSFLTMMSHELRTPMNGVLGMLALTKESGLAESQSRLIEQAERSGQQMIAMLGDILDFASLQDQEIVFVKKPFEPRQLAAAVGELFGSVARREGIDFDVKCAPSCPNKIEGDFRRLRQIIAHFASYIVDTAGTRRVEISLMHDDGNLGVAIDFDYGAPTGTTEIWRPDIILGARDMADDKFASDALGPAVARGLLDQMGGEVRLAFRDGDSISIVINVPAKEVILRSPVVHIETRSRSLNTICRMALAGEEFRIHTPESSDPVNIVLLEAGGMHEADNIARMSKAHPSALLFAIGAAMNPSEFDGVIATPLDISALQQSMRSTIAV